MREKEGKGIREREGREGDQRKGGNGGESEKRKRRESEKKKERKRTHVYNNPAFIVSDPGDCLLYYTTSSQHATHNVEFSLTPFIYFFPSQQT